MKLSIPWFESKSWQRHQSRSGSWSGSWAESVSWSDHTMVTEFSFGAWSWSWSESWPYSQPQGWLLD